MTNSHCFPSHEFDLKMTLSGFGQLRAQLASKDKKDAQIYIHIGSQGALKDTVIRIGKAEGGIYSRWISSKQGHKNTFEWAIGTSDRYGIKNAVKHPRYLPFFASLLGLETRLKILTVPKSIIGAEENKLIHEYAPMWTNFMREFRVFYRELTDEQRAELVNWPGGFLRAIEQQRNGELLFSIPVHDVLKLPFATNTSIH